MNCYLSIYYAAFHFILVFHFAFRQVVLNFTCPNPTWTGEAGYFPFGKEYAEKQDEANFSPYFGKGYADRFRIPRRPPVEYLESIKFAEESTRPRDADALLDRFTQTSAKNCKRGASRNAIHINLNYNRWEKAATPVATKSANSISTVLSQNKCSLGSLSDRSYYNSIVSDMMSQRCLYGSACAFECGMHPKNQLFSTCAIKDGKGIKAFDIASIYDYTKDNTQYWEVPKQLDEGDIRQIEVEIKPQGKRGKIVETLPAATRKSGNWTAPYFDCERGDVWITSCSCPITCNNQQKGRNIFAGVAYVDINLSEEDINQCDLGNANGEKDAFNDIFLGTHRCHKSTQCKPKSGVGLRRGGYECVCKPGYYFPNKGEYRKAFDGLKIEDEYYFHGDLSRFQCLPCKPGCKECSDGDTCIWPRYKRSNYSY